MIGRFVGWVGVVLVLAGCNAVPTAPAAEAVSTVRKVGVVSLAAHELHRLYLGVTVFEEERERENIESWKVDDEYEQQVVAALGKFGKVQAVRVPEARKELYRVYEVTSPWDRKPKWDELATLTRSVAERAGVDALVLVLARDANDFVSPQPRMSRGPGFFARGIGSWTRYSVMHVLADVVLVDGHSGNVLASRILAAEQGGSRGTASTAPVSTVPPEVSRAKLSERTEAQRAEIRAGLIELPRPSWEPTMRALFTPPG